MHFLEQVVVAALLQTIFQNSRKGRTRKAVAARYGLSVQLCCARSVDTGGW